MVQATVPGMKSRGWGRIIQIGTGLANTPQAVLADYAAAKTALVNMTVSLAKALAGTNITINTISPGAIGTAGVETVLKNAAERLGWGDDWPTIQKTGLKKATRPQCATAGARGGSSGTRRFRGQPGCRIH
jgi:NAD(P)-dependent dehydrogenase (short-subunit alcohol dehydrogenase family)